VFEKGSIFGLCSKSVVTNVNVTKAAPKTN